MPEIQRRFIDLNAAAELLGVDTATLRRWAAQGRITLYRVGPRLLRVDVAELDALVRPVPTAQNR